MIKLYLAAAGLAALGGITYWNYSRRMPKPCALTETSCAVTEQVMTIEANGHRLYGELLLPQGQTNPLPTVICCHGFGASYKLFTKGVGKSLAMSGFAVYCFDFYGGSRRSKSGGAMTEMSIFTEQQDLCAVIEKIRELPMVDTSRLYLLGESQGGCVAGITAPLYKDWIRAMVLYYPAFSLADDARARFSSVESIPDTYRILGQKISRTYSEKLLDYDVYQHIVGYTGPVLIVHGDADRVVDVSYGKKAAEQYQNAEIVTLPGEDHGFSGKGKITAAHLTYDFLRKQM